MTMPNPVEVLCICGLGMGSSLILRMTMETAMNRMELNAEIDYTDFSSAQSMEPDAMVGQGMHTNELEEAALIIVPVDDLLDDAAVEEKPRAVLMAAGWDACWPRRRWELPPVGEMSYAPP